MAVPGGLRAAQGAVEALAVRADLRTGVEDLSGVATGVLLFPSNAGMRFQHVVL